MFVSAHTGKRCAPFHRNTGNQSSHWMDGWMHVFSDKMDGGLSVCIRRDVSLLTHGLQVDVDKVEAIVLQGVVWFSRDVQVAVALLVAQVHLNP